MTSNFIHVDTLLIEMIKRKHAERAKISRENTGPVINDYTLRERVMMYERFAECGLKPISFFLPFFFYIYFHPFFFSLDLVKWRAGINADGNK